MLVCMFVYQMINLLFIGFQKTFMAVLLLAKSAKWGNFCLCLCHKKKKEIKIITKRMQQTIKINSKIHNVFDMK